jgi:hypothetical protein
MRKSIRAASVAALGAALALGPTGPVQADETTPPGAPTITAPTQDASFQPGDPISFAVAGATSWSIESSCMAGDGSFSLGTATDLHPVVTAENQDPVTAACSALLYADGDAGVSDSVDFTIAAAPVAQKPNNVTITAVAPRTFFPRIRDGYRDSVAFTLRSYQDTRISMSVNDRSGRTVVRKKTVRQPWEGWDGLDTDSFSWNGRNSAGSVVPVGQYKVTFTSEGVGYKTVSSATWVTVASGFQNVTRTLTKDGWLGSTDRTRGNCWATEGYYPHGNDLDCWGGAYAQATYTFRVPARARITRWFAHGERRCCSNGRVIKTGKRTSRTVFRVRVKVTNWAAYTVTRAGITYRARVRV